MAKIRTKIKTLIYDNSIMSNVMINLVLLAFCYIIGFTYETNDDYALEHIPAGFNGEPNAYMIHTNVIIGKILSLAYRLLPGIKWYVVFSYAVIFIAFCVISFVIDKKINGICNVLIKYPFLLIFGIEIYVKLQYTKTAGVAAVAGMLLLSLLYSENYEKKKNIIVVLVSGILLLCGCMIRIEAFLLCAPYFTIMLVMINILSIKSMLSEADQEVRKKEKNRLIKNISCVLGVFFLCAIVRLLDVYSYQSKPEWKFYRDFNTARTKIVDYWTPEYEDAVEGYTAAGVSENDLYMIKCWAFGDTDYYSLERLDAMAKLQEGGKKFGIQNIKNLFTIVIPERISEPTFRILLYILCVLLIFSEKSVITALIWVGTLGLDCAALTYYDFVGRVKNRVNVVIWLLTLVVILTFTIIKKQYQSDESIKKADRLYNIVGLIVIVLIITMNSSEYVSSYKNYKASYVDSIDYKNITLNIAKDKDTLYVNDPLNDMFQGGWLGVFDALPYGVVFDNVVNIGGWEVSSPSWFYRMYSKGISNFYRDSVDRNVIFITDEDRASHIERFINEHYNPVASMCKVREFADGKGFYKVVTGVSPLEISTLKYEVSDDLTGIVHDLRIIDCGEGFKIEGTAFKEGLSSYNQSVLLINGKPDQGKEWEAYSVLQSESSVRDEDTKGRYGNFSTYISKGIVGEDYNNVSIVVIIEGTAYKIPFDEVM